jgi:hypothetical protein
MEKNYKQKYYFCRLSIVGQYIKIKGILNMKRDLVLSITFITIGLIFLFSMCSQNDESKRLDSNTQIVATKMPENNTKINQTPIITKKPETTATATSKKYRTFPPSKNLVDVN